MVKENIPGQHDADGWSSEEIKKKVDHPGVELARLRGQEIRSALSGLTTTVDGTESLPKDTVRDQFVIQLPALHPDEKGNSDATNQDRMFQLRTEFLKADPEGVYAWVPQAVEAYRRAQKSDLLPDFGVIRAIGVNVHTDTVQIITQSAEAGAVPFELKLSELATYSLELLLRQAEQKEPMPAFKYSSDMQKAIDKLSPSAKFRWDLITRAAYLQAKGLDYVAAKPVSNSISVIDGRLEGVGVFTKNKARFSLVKVIHADVPMTSYEKDILEQSSRAPRIDSDDPELKAFVEFVYNINNILRDFSKEQHKMHQWYDRLKGKLGKDTPISLHESLHTLVADFLNAKMALASVEDQAREEVLRAKVAFEDDHPFELKELSADFSGKFNTAIEAYRQAMIKLHEFVLKKNAVIKKAIAAATSESHNGTNADTRMTRGRTPYLAAQHAKRRDAVMAQLDTFNGNAKTFENTLKGALPAGKEQE